jgi:hypothetical protein
MRDLYQVDPKEKEQITEEAQYLIAKIGRDKNPKG